MAFRITCDTANLENELRDWEQRKLPYATATALTRTAKTIQGAFIMAMKQDFDRPTPYTLSSTYVKPATARVLTAEVGWKNWAAKSVPPSKYMLPQVQGGARSLKSSEKMLAGKALLPSGMVTVPGSGAAMDQYGNMKPSQLVQVLSALRAFPEAGYLANRARAGKTAKNQPQFFVGSPGGGRLPLGVYQRTADGGLKPILIFVKSPNYKILIPFAAIAERVYTADFQEEFNRAMRDMVILTPFVSAA